MSDDPELDKLAANRATIWDCTLAEARQRLLDEAAAERWTRQAADLAELAQIEADAGVTDVQVVSTDPPVAIVSSLALAAQGTLSADYWVNRHDGESVEAYRHRMLIEDIEARADRHDARARKLRNSAAELRGGDPAEVVSEFDRGRADMLRELAMMDAAERAEILSRRRHPSGGDTPP